jgi:hypothetical protein
MIQGINSLNNSILSNETRIKMRKTVNLSKLVASKGFSMDFKNPLYHPHDGHSPIITSSTISHKNTSGIVVSGVYVTDDGYGKLNLVNTDSDGKISLVYPNIGTIDYENGVVSMNTSFSPTSTSQFFTITVEPKNKDIFVFENKILRVSRGYPDSVSVSLQSQTNRKQSLKA